MSKKLVQNFLFCHKKNWYHSKANTNWYPKKGPYHNNRRAFFLTILLYTIFHDISAFSFLLPKFDIICFSSTFSHNIQTYSMSQFDLSSLTHPFPIAHFCCNFITQPIIINITLPIFLYLIVFICDTTFFVTEQMVEPFLLSFQQTNY